MERRFGNIEGNIDGAGEWAETKGKRQQEEPGKKTDEAEQKEEWRGDEVDKDVAQCPGHFLLFSPFYSPDPSANTKIAIYEKGW